MTPKRKVPLPSAQQVKEWRKLFATNPKTGRQQYYPALKSHVEGVRRYSVLLGKACQKAGLPINVGLLNRAAQLHDVAMPSRNFYPKPVARHEKLGAEFVRRKGFPEVARIIGEHGDIGGRRSDKEREIELVRAKMHATFEGKILDYVDSRLQDGKPVPLAEKLKYLLGRYGAREQMPIYFQDPLLRDAVAISNYKRYIREKYELLERFEEELRKKGIDVEKILTEK